MSAPTNGTVGYTDKTYSEFLCPQCRRRAKGDASGDFFRPLTRTDLDAMRLAQPAVCCYCGALLLRDATTCTPHEQAADAAALRLHEIGERVSEAMGALDDLYCDLRDTPLRDHPKRRHLMDLWEKLQAVALEIESTTYALSPVRPTDGGAS